MRTAGGHPQARWAFAGAAAVVALLLALQGGFAAADEPALASRAKTVSIDGFAYRPATVTVSRGTRVTWVNSDGVKHTATRASSFDTGRIKPGKSATVRFGQRGTFRYHCKIHNFMKGKIVVQ
jgi:plastocyanin